MSEKPSGMKALLLGLGLTVFGLAFALVLVEIVFRLIPAGKVIAWSDRPVAYFKPESSPNMQDFAYADQKAAGTLRVAVIGDSFTFAPYMQFDDTFVKRLERWLNLNEKQPKVEVINYGVPRYSTSHEIPVVKKAIEQGADVILMQITLNDPEIKLDWPTELMPDSKGELSVTGGIFDYWKSAAFVATRLKNRASQDEYRDYFFKLFDNKKNWEQFSGSWKEIVKIAADANKPVVAVVFPLFGMTVNDSYPFFPLHERVGKFMDELNVKHLDLTESYRDIPVDRLQVIPVQDRHPNEIGHRIAAEAILRWLPEAGVLPADVFPKGQESQRIGIIPKSKQKGR